MIRVEAVFVHHKNSSSCNVYQYSTGRENACITVPATMSSWKCCSTRMRHDTRMKQICTKFNSIRALRSNRLEQASCRLLSVHWWIDADWTTCWHWHAIHHGASVWWADCWVHCPVSTSSRRRHITRHSHASYDSVAQSITWIAITTYTCSNTQLNYTRFEPAPQIRALLDYCPYYKRFCWLNGWLEFNSNLAYTIPSLYAFSASDDLLVGRQEKHTM